MKLIITGRPVPAVRMTQRSKYMSKQAQRYLDYKTQIGWEAKAAGAQMKHGAFQMSAIAYFKPHKHDMDVDNLAKAFMDGLNGIAWYDDLQVIKLNVEKVYVDHENEERAEIEIKEVSA